MRPLLPFPLPINIGNDICQIQRIYSIVSSPKALRFVNLVLTKEEQVSNEPRLRVLQNSTSSNINREKDTGKVDSRGRSQSLSHDESSDERTWKRKKRNPAMWATASFLAGRFAAKEATFKAHPHRRLTFHDIVIEPRGPPRPSSGDYLGSGPKIARIRGEKRAAAAAAGHVGDGAAAESGHEPDASAMISISHDGDYAMASCLAYDASVAESHADKDSDGGSGS